MLQVLRSPPGPGLSCVFTAHHYKGDEKKEIFLCVHRSTKDIFLYAPLSLQKSSWTRKATFTRKPGVALFLKGVYGDLRHV